MNKEEEIVHAFQVGDLVQWTSKAGSYRNTKTGRVIMVLQPGEYPSKAGGVIWQELGAMKKSIWPLERLGDPTEYNWGALRGGVARREVSYMVLVQSKSFRGRHMLYWPRTTQLRWVSRE